jgi:hypothetical protein
MGAVQYEGMALYGELLEADAPCTLIVVGDSVILLLTAPAVADAQNRTEDSMIPLDPLSILDH